MNDYTKIYHTAPASPSADWEKNLTKALRTV